MPKTLIYTAGIDALFKVPNIYVVVGDSGMHWNQSHFVCHGSSLSHSARLCMSHGNVLYPQIQTGSPSDDTP